MTLSATDVSWTRGGALVVDGVTLHPQPGQTVGLLGPNGSGKSSLLRLLQGLARPDRGLITLDGDDISGIGRREVAQKVATVSQQAETDADITVYDVVRLGRTPYRGLFGGGSARDDAVVRDALAQVDLVGKEDRLWHALSGGERQRAHIARALAQEPRELLLDEPTNHLDIRHQLDLLRLVTGLPVTTVIAMHDLNLAAMFCDTVVVLSFGRVVAAGPPAEVLSEELIHGVYGVRSRVTADPASGVAHIAFIP
ncbi:ABC transporter ATP-binding protein [Microbacterium sp.]|uniref:ABC transporter ATP-binding protein n=1 Tax=Microbacterium sp. TaxID=51671 RepID=UPI002811A007|nr:ABC transporter ATP-binding protein [Microbacterium sp.]